jgi:uncharacterized protein
MPGIVNGNADVAAGYTATMAPRAAGLHMIDPLTLCREGGQRAGRSPLSGMPRLGQGVEAVPGADVAWKAVGQWREVAGGEPQAWLHVEASAQVLMQCQRCLQRTEVRLAVDRRFRFARTEAEAARLDEEIDDDVLVLPQRLDLHALLEDELILALPLVPRHAGPCPEPLPQPVQVVADAEEAPHPFASLAALRGGAGTH